MANPRHTVRHSQLVSKAAHDAYTKFLASFEQNQSSTSPFGTSILGDNLGAPTVNEPLTDAYSDSSFTVSPTSIAAPSSGTQPVAQNERHTSKLPSLRGDHIKHVIIGKEKASFYVHENILCSASPFFKAAFTGNFKEGAEGDIFLPEDDPPTFERFLEYIYTKSYNLSTYVSDTPEDCQRQTWDHVRLYVFAEKVQVEPLQHHIIRSLFELEAEKKTKHTAANDCMEFAYDNTPPGSPLRKLLAASYVWHKRGLDYGTLTRIPELAADVAISLYRMILDNKRVNPFLGTAYTFLPASSGTL